MTMNLNEYIKIKSFINLLLGKTIRSVEDSNKISGKDYIVSRKLIVDTFKFDFNSNCKFSEKKMTNKQALESEFNLLAIE